ncbi:MAG: hypothetical protein AAFX06_34485, partial [Planctomycetota bacterium]
MLLAGRQRDVDDMEAREPGLGDAVGGDGRRHVEAVDIEREGRDAGVVAADFEVHGSYSVPRGVVREIGSASSASGKTRPLATPAT